MKFAEYLATHLTPEWRKQYIDYDKMKKMLYDAIEEVESQSIDEESPENTQAYQQFEKVWFQFSNDELDKINTFFKEKLEEAIAKCERLHQELDAIRTEELCCRNHTGIDHRFIQYNNNNDLTITSNSSYIQVRQYKPQVQRKISAFKGRSQRNSTKLSRNKMQELKLAFSEFYLSLILLQNYQKINFTGFRKIQKKHDKLFATGAGAKWREEYVDSAEFHTNKENDQLIERTEGTVINELEGGDRPKAMKRLRVPTRDMRQNPWVTFKVGLYAGIFIVLLAVTVLTFVLELNSEVKDYRLAFRLYRGPFLFIFFLFLLSINIYGWRASGVNHILIFELDPRKHLGELQLLELAAFLGILWQLSVLAFLYSAELGIPAYSSPLALFLLLIGFLFNPTKTCHHHSRFWLLRVLSRILGAPFFYVGFADFWLADQLNSLSQVLIDSQYIVCFYATSNGNFDYQADEDIERCVSETWLLRAFIAIIPAWCRFMQCLRRYRDTREAFPHLVNAGKYSTTFFVIGFSTIYSRTDSTVAGEDTDVSNFNIYFMFWILAAVTSSIYAYVWDMKMDWGLFHSGAGKNRFLRKEIVYPKLSYYFGIIEDLFLRFGWVLSYSLTELDFIHKDILVTVLTPLELFRRFVWNFFRLENEHLNNCGKFRAVRDITIASLHAAHHRHGSGSKKKKAAPKVAELVRVYSLPVHIQVS